MFRQRCAILGVVSFVIVALLPESSFAQSDIIAGSVTAGQSRSAIVLGQVIDESGAVLQGVTVMLRSPALQVP